MSANKFRCACSNANEKWWETNALISFTNFSPSFTFSVVCMHMCVLEWVSECLSILSFCVLLMVTCSFDNIPHSMPVLPLSNYTQILLQLSHFLGLNFWMEMLYERLSLLLTSRKIMCELCVCVKCRQYILFLNARKLEIEIELISLISALRWCKYMKTYTHTTHMVVMWMEEMHEIDAVLYVVNTYQKNWEWEAATSMAAVVMVWACTNNEGGFFYRLHSLFAVLSPWHHTYMFYIDDYVYVVRWVCWIFNVFNANKWVY